jgi:K+-transporting ATPase ATPase C chain
MKKHFITAILMTVVTTVLLGIIYPVVVWGLAQVIFPKQANGSLITANGKIVGSQLIGQPFSSPGYFRSRPSAAGSAGYDSGNSSGSNLVPTNKMLDHRMNADIQKAQAKSGVPVRWTSHHVRLGLDPHISPEAAAFPIHASPASAT